MNSILVVEHDAASLAARARVFRDAGFEVLAASHGAEVLRLARERRPDLVLLDVMVPDMSGVLAAQGIKADPELAGTFIVDMSARTGAAVDQSAGLEAGADGFIAGPIDNRELLARVRTFLRVKHLTDALRRSQVQMRRLIDQSPDAILVVARDHDEILFANPGAARLLRRSAGELAGQPFEHRRQDHKTAEIEITHSDGGRLIAEMRASPCEWMGAESTMITLHEATARRREEIGHPCRSLVLPLQAERRLAAMFAEATTGIATTAIDGRFIDANPAYCRMVGYTLQELRAVHVEALIHSEDRAEHARLVSEAMTRNLSSFNGETRYVRKDGGIVDCRASMSIVRGEDHEPLQIVGIFEDLSEGKAVAAQLRHSQSLLEIAGRMARVGGWSLDLPERRLVWSDVVAAIHDAPPGYLPALNEGIELFLPAYRDVVRSAVERCIADGTPYDLEVEKFSILGRRFWTRTMGEAERDSSGRIVRIHGAFQEISQRKIAEEAMRDSEERFSGAFEHAPIGVALVSPDGRFLKVNRALCHLVGYAEDEMLLRNFQGITHPQDLEADLANMRKLLAGESATYQMEKRFVHERGHFVSVMLNVSLVRDAQDRPRYFISQFQDITARKLAEEELRKQKEFLAVLIESGTDGIIACSADGVITLINRAMRELHGLSAEPLATAEGWAGASDLYLPDGQTRMTNEQRPLYRALREGRVRDVEMVIAPAHGPVRRVVANGQALYAAGRMTGAVVAVRDVTDERRAEESIALQAHMLDSIGQAVIATDLGGQITYANRFAESLYGWARGEIVGKNILDATVSQASRKQALQVLAQHERADSWRGEYPVRRRGGTEFLASVTNTTLRDRRGAVVGILGVSEDISERKLAEAALRLQHAQLSNAQRVGGMGLWELDTQRNSLLWSQETHRIFGVPAETFAQNFEAFFALVHPEDALWMRPLYLHPPTDGSAVELEYRIRRPNGEERIVFERGEITYDADGQPLRKSGVVMDITERRRDQDALKALNTELEGRVLARTAELKLARDEAEQASRAKSGFLAAMSHEIRTPMNGVIGMLDVLQQTPLQGDQLEMVGLIRDSASSLLAIISDILDFSKIEAGKFQIAHEPMDLGRVVEQVCSMLDPLAAKQGVRMTVFVDPEIPSIVLGDEGRLRQVLVNLCGNALKFSAGRSQPGRVSTRAILAGRDPQAVTVDLVVADDGIGMDSAMLAQLFTPFSQGDESTTRRFGGTGLGLAISNTLVRLMGGEISVRSAPDKGSTFTVRLRVATAPTLLGGDDEGRPLVDGLRCRIVSSESPLADDFGSYLIHAGAIVERSPDIASAASAAAAEQAPGLSLWLILPDQTLPGPAELREMAPHGADSQVGFILFGQGRRRCPRVVAQDVVSIDVNALARHTLFRTLGLASGRVRPVSDEERRPAVDATLALPRLEAALRNPTILVAEDNETNRAVIRRQLQLAGYTAVLCVNGRDALESWRCDDFALVLTDLHMPEMDGYALAKAIRAEEGSRGRRTPIIALTANALRDEELRCLAVGMDAYLTKPVRLPELKAAIETWIA